MNLFVEIEFLVNTHSKDEIHRLSTICWTNLCYKYKRKNHIQHRFKSLHYIEKPHVYASAPKEDEMEDTQGNQYLRFPSLWPSSIIARPSCSILTRFCKRKGS